jgi:hypothetical protein
MMRLPLTFIRILGYVVTGLLLRISDSTLKDDSLLPDFVGSLVELDIVDTLVGAESWIG